MIPIQPHHISCALYIRTIINKTKTDDVWAEEIPVESQRKMFLAALKFIRNTDMTWHQFQQQLQSTCHDLFPKFVKEIHELQSIDQLMSVFQTFDLLFESQELLLKKSSVLGLFLRKIVLDFKKLPFHSINLLAMTMRSYLNVSINLEAKNEKTFDFSRTDMDASSMDVTSMEESLLEDEKENIAVTPHMVSPLPSSSNLSKDEIFLSRNKVVRFVYQQAKLLENNDSSALTPRVLEDKINEINKLYPNIFDVHYLRFLNYLRVSETNNAIVSLQLYFDYKVFNEETNDADITDIEKHQMKFKRFRYCALNLGIMHCYHGNYAEAMIALEEAIRISQETNDHKCLSHAMFWLSLVKEETGCLDEGLSHLKQFIADKTKELIDADGMSNAQMIDYLGLLRYVKIQAFKGINIPSNLLCTSSQIIISNIMVSDSAQLLRSALFDFYGFKLNAMYGCQIPLQYLYPHTAEIAGNSHHLSEESVANSLCQLAVQHSTQGCYHEALCILKFAKNQFSLYSPHHKKVKQCEMEITFNQCIRERNLEEAREISEGMYGVDKNEGKFTSAVVDLLLGNFSAAFKSANQMLTLFDNDVDVTVLTPSLKVKLMLLLVEIQLLSSNSAQAVDKILDLLTYINSKHMNSSKVDAKICLVRYQITLGLMDKASSVINDLIVEAIANGDCYQQGMLFFLQAKCLIQNTTTIGETDQKSRWLQVLSMLDKSMKYFKNGNMKARMRDIYYEQALVYNRLDYFQERNKASTQYRLLHEEIKDLPNILLF